MYKILLFIMIFIFMSSCTLTKQQRQSNKVVKKIEKMKIKYPEAFRDATTETIRIDTVIQEIEIEGELRIDTFEIEVLIEKLIYDTIPIPEFIDRFFEATRDSVQIDTLGLHIFIAGSNVVYKIIKDEQHIEMEKDIETIHITNTTVIKKRFYRDWLFWLVIIIYTLLWLTYIKGIRR